jgi:hypothetical protein
MNVVFRGVMLFCSQGHGDDTILREVILPDCEDRIPPFGSKHGDQFYHLDDTRAVPHYAGILVATKKEQAKYYQIRGVDVTIGDVAADPPKIGEKIKGFANTGDIKENGDLLEVDWDARRSSRITLGAGPSDNDHVKAKQPRYYKFKVKNQGNLHNSLTLTYPNDAKIKTSSNEFPEIPVPADATVYIYNFDDPEPTVKELEGEKPTTKPFIIDHDFKWIYSILKPTREIELDEWAEGYLPAPQWLRSSANDDEFKILERRAITVSTCFPGWIQDE